MYSQTTKNIIKQLAAKYHLPISEIEKIIQIPQDIMYALMRESRRKENHFNNTYIPGLGKFIVTKQKKSFIKWQNDKYLAKVEGILEQSVNNTEEKNIQVVDTPKQC